MLRRGIAIDIRLVAGCCRYHVIMPNGNDDPDRLI